MVEPVSVRMNGVPNLADVAVSVRGGLCGFRAFSAIVEASQRKNS
jgi:hypothetical protein